MAASSDVFQSTNMWSWLHKAAVSGSNKIKHDVHECKEDVNKEIPMSKAEMDKKICVSLEEQMNSSRQLFGLAVSTRA